MLGTHKKSKRARGRIPRAVRGKEGDAKPSALPSLVEEDVAGGERVSLGSR